MPQGEQVVVVTGISSGMGFETSLMLARNGFHTYATMRKLESGGGSKQIADIAKMRIYAYKLFSEGRKPLEVAIELGLQ